MYHGFQCKVANICAAWLVLACSSQPLSTLCARVLLDKSNIMLLTLKNNLQYFQLIVFGVFCYWHFLLHSLTQILSAAIIYENVWELTVVIFSF